MHDRLLEALDALGRFLTDNHRVACKDEAKRQRLHDLDGQIRYFSDRLNLNFPDGLPWSEKSFGFCKVPYFVHYDTVSEHVINGVKGTAHCDPVDCFALTFDWQRSFETFVAIVQADKANQPRGPIPSYVRPENAAPLSRLDLPRILDAIGELHRTIENPPATNWKAPVWLVEQYKQTAAGKLPLKDGEQPHHSWLIFAAATEVLNRLTPPWHHRKDDCPEITESSLDQKHKVKLIELRNRLSEEFFGQILADNRSVALQTLHYLESLIMDLTGKEGDRPAPNITYINYGINKGIMGDANQQVNADSFNTDVHAADVSKPQEAKGAKCARPTQVPNEAD